MPGTLYIVPTPIGNLEDLTRRAERTLREVDLIACEDTRHTKALLNHLGISKKTISYHEHNERERAAELCDVLAAGDSVALVSDAGTPLISDPGFRLVQAAIRRNLPIVSLPGPTALAAALAISGLATDQFLFAGFLPSRRGSRRARLENLRSITATLCFYEAPHRLIQTVKDALEILGDRRATVARELTKIHEEVVRARLSELEQRLSEATSVKGEIVLLIEGAGEEEGNLQPTREKRSSLTQRVNELKQEGLSEKDALKKSARELGLKRDEAYRMLVAQKNRRTK